MSRTWVLPVVAATSLALAAPVAVAEVPDPAAGATVAQSAATDSRPRSAPLPGTTCPAFPADNYWHADVRKLPVHKRSEQWLSHMSTAGRNLHPDFGPSYGEQSVPYGIPITVVDGAAKVRVSFDYASESDRERVVTIVERLMVKSLGKALYSRLVTERRRAPS